MVPMIGCSRGSTTSVREVPIASGWPGQSAADAACAATQVSTPDNKPADSAVQACSVHACLHGRLILTLAIIKPGFISNRTPVQQIRKTEVLDLVVVCGVLFKRTGIFALSE